MQISLSEQRNGIDRGVARVSPPRVFGTFPAIQLRSVRMPTAKDLLIRSAGLLETLILGPAMWIMYTFASWDFSYSIGLNHSFLWSTGPLSNWMIWLGGALVLTVLARLLSRVSVPE
jgi:hypothetical protein